MKPLHSQQVMADTLDRIANTGTLNGAVLGASKKTIFGWMRKTELTCEWQGRTLPFADHVAAALDQHRLLALPLKPLDPNDFIERAQLLRKVREKRAELQAQQAQRHAMAAEARRLSVVARQHDNDPAQQQIKPPIITRGRISGQIKASIDRDSENLGSGRDGVAPGGFVTATARRERVVRKRGLPYSLFG